MALKATIYKAELNIADMDRHYYRDHALTLACHPSETLERLMVRLLAYCLFADEALGFCKGLSADDEPDLWQKDLTGAITRWIEVGLPDERRLRRACGRAQEVIVLAYGGRATDLWWQQNAAALARNNNLRVLAISAEQASLLTTLGQRSMRLDCLIQDGQAWLADARQRHEMTPRQLHPSNQG